MKARIRTMLGYVPLITLLISIIIYLNINDFSRIASDAIGAKTLFISLLSVKSVYLDKISNLAALILLVHWLLIPINALALFLYVVLGKKPNVSNAQEIGLKTWAGLGAGLLFLIVYSSGNFQFTDFPTIMNGNLLFSNHAHSGVRSAISTDLGSVFLGWICSLVESFVLFTMAFVLLILGHGLKQLGTSSD